VVSSELILQTLKCNLNLKTREGFTALDIAKAKGHIAVFELFKKFSPTISSESKVNTSICEVNY
jgi:ankyrin repeat protein